MRLSILNQTEDIEEKLIEYIEHKGYVFDCDDTIEDPFVKKRLLYANGDERVQVTWLSELSDNAITVYHSVKDWEFWNEFFKDGCPKCKAQKLTPSNLLFFKKAPGVESIIENVELSSTFGAYDRIGTVPPNWICKACGLEWGNEDDLREWSKKCAEGKELFDYSIIDWENKDKGRFRKKSRFE